MFRHTHVVQTTTTLFYNTGHAGIRTTTADLIRTLAGIDRMIENIRKTTSAAVLRASSAGTGLAGERPEWAFFVPSAEAAKLNAMPRSDVGAQWSAPGSRRAYAPSQSQDVLNPPDWYPDEHPTMPEIVAHGSRTGANNPPLLPCALCHLPN